MSRRADRPEPLQRLVRRSDRRLLLAAGWFAAFVAVDITAAIDEDRLFDGATMAEAVVDDDYNPGSGDLTVPLLIGERRTETRPVYDAPLPRANEVVQVEIAAGQPGVVRLSGASYPVQVDRLFQVAPFVVCLLLALGRRRFVRRVMRRAESEERAFELVGVVRAAPLSRRVCLLDLYALDDAGQPPLASVPLATTAGLPIGVPVRVSAKGVPRAFGLVVCRSDLGVLWPAAPATGATRRSPGRPSGLSEVEPLATADRPGPSGLAVRSFWRRPGPIALGASLLVLALVIAVAAAGVARDERRKQTWGRAAASVVDGHATDCRIDVAYRAAGEPRRDVVPVGDCVDVPEGDGYVVLVDPEDPDQALLLSELYNPWVAGGYAVALVLVGVWWATHDLRRHRQVQAAIAGPWRTAILDRDDGDAIAVRGDADPRATARAWTISDGSRAAIVAHGPRTAAVAGDVEPGAWFVTWLPGEQIADEHHGNSRPLGAAWWRS